VLVLSALVEIDQVGNGHYIIAIKNSMLLLDPFQHRRREIAPTQLRGEPVPDDQVAFIETTPFFETLLQDFFIRSALEYAFAKIGVIYPQKIATGAISGPGAA
jgi:hypothetical protein